MPNNDTDDWTWDDESPRPEPLRLRWLLGGLLLAGMFALGWWYNAQVGAGARTVEQLRHELYPQVWRAVQQDLQDDLHTYGIDTIIYGPVTLVGDGVSVSHSLIWATLPGPAIRVQGGTGMRIDTVKVQAEGEEELPPAAPSPPPDFRDPRASHRVLFPSKTEEGIMHEPHPWTWNTPLLLDPEASTMFRESITFHNVRLSITTPFGSLTPQQVDELRASCRQVEGSQPGQSVRFRAPAGVHLEWGKFLDWCHEEEGGTP